MSQWYPIVMLVVLLSATFAQANGPVKREYPPLPVGVSSLGAVVCDGHLYVYGGHAGKTHSYDTKLADHS